MRVKFAEYDCEIVFGHYVSDNNAIRLVDATDGQPVATASTNPTDEILAEDEVAIKDYSENEGMLEVLKTAGIVSTPIRFVTSGYVKNIPICKILRRK